MNNETIDTTNDETTNDETTNDDVRNVHHARNVRDHFTIAQLSRDVNVDAKIARRRLRDAIKRNDDRIVDIVSRERDDMRDDMRVKHEFRNEHRETLISIITNK